MGIPGPLYLAIVLGAQDFFGGLDRANHITMAIKTVAIESASSH